jgi:hypothetical protein
LGFGSHLSAVVVVVVVVRLAHAITLKAVVEVELAALR